jgi:hypothetical protein
MDRMMSDQVTPKNLCSLHPVEARPSKVRIWSKGLRRTSFTSPINVLTRLTYTSFDVKELNRLFRRTAGLPLRFGGPLTLGIVFRATIDRL